MRPLLDRPNVRDGSIHVRMIDIVMQNMQSFYAEHHEDNILLRFQMFLNCIKIPGNDVPEFSTVGMGRLPFAFNVIIVFANQILKIVFNSLYKVHPLDTDTRCKCRHKIADNARPQIIVKEPSFNRIQRCTNYADVSVGKGCAICLGKFADAQQLNCFLK